MSSLARGTDSEFATFVRGHSAGLLRTAYLLTGDQIDAENLLRTALIRTRLAGHPFGDTRAADTSVRKLMVAMLTSRWWARVWRRTRPGVEEVPVKLTQPSSTERAVRDRLWAEIEDLPLNQRVLIVTRYYDNLTEAETAELTNSTIETVGSQTEQVLQTLARDDAEDHWAPNWRDAPKEPANRVGRLLRDTFAERAAEIELPADWAKRALRSAKLVRRSRVVAPVAAVGVLLAVVVGATGPVGLEQGTADKPSATPTEGADRLPAALERLPTGSPPSVPYVVGRTVVLAPDRRVELPGEYRTPGPNSLGGTRHGLLLVPLSIDTRGTLPLHIGGDGTVTELDAEPGSYGGHVISPDGRYAAWTTRAGFYDGPAFAKITDLRTGDVIASRELPERFATATNDLRVPRIHAFDGNAALVVGSDTDGDVSYARWTPADGRLEPQRGPTGLESIWASSLSGDTLLATVADSAGDGDHCLVNVSIAAPDRERWRLCDTESAPFISPDARLVALRRAGTPDGDHGNVSLEVRDLETGDVVAGHDIDLPQSSVWVPMWESGAALLVVVQDRKDSQLTPHLLRCPVSADRSCERVPAPDGQRVTAIAVQRFY